MRYTNKNNLSLLLSAWAIDDDYNNQSDKFPNQEVISVTSLIKPTRQFVLNTKIDYELYEIDISDRIASRYGSAIHDSIEKTWKHKYKRSLKLLGYPTKVIEDIRINPEKDDPSKICIYLEQRYFKEIDGIIISGQVDQIIDGMLSDVKSTSTFSYLSGSNEDKHIKQASIYRWLKPEIIKEDYVEINYVFTDWQSFKAKQDTKYPQTRALAVKLPLMSYEDTELYIKERIFLIKENKVLPDQNNMIKCTDSELWKSDPVHKYYGNPLKTDGRATKNFDCLSEANKFLSEKGKGIIITVDSEPKACNYCPAYTICEQRKEYFDD